MPGPVPKRSTQRRRRNAPNVETVAATGTVAVPPTPSGLHPIAARWFDSLKESGQSTWYEPSDWAAAELVAHAMTKMLRARKFSSMAFTAVWSAMGELLTTEGARRRAKVEIERDQTEVDAAPPGVTAIEQYRKKAQG
jgi:hypothetical protein